MIDYSLSFSIAALLFSVVALIICVFSYAKIVGFENSTHQIQYVPAPQPEPYNPDSDHEPFGPAGDELIKKFAPEFDDEDML